MEQNKDTAQTQQLLPNVEHVIVVMFENRSFDNVLGGLYPSGPGFNGVPPGWSVPFTLNGQTTQISAWQGNDSSTQIMPFPDPQEDHDDMESQINGGNMDGFADNYATTLKNPTIDSVKQIMQYYTADYMPVSHRLASMYAVSDTYFGSGPVQTWPNRLFAHSGTPGSNFQVPYLNNDEYPNYPLIEGQLKWKTVFELLDEKYPDSQNNWKVYYDDEAPISALFDYVDDRWNKFERGGNVLAYKSDFPSIYDDFFSDIASGNLPKYSFIEPRYQENSAEGIIPPNSNHPGPASIFPDSHTPIDVANGETMLNEIYGALISNPDLFAKTLLIVTYDEHGGLFDHVAPPAAMSPFAPGTVKGFDYNQYGPRVPAIFINPYIKSGTVLRPPSGQYFDHTSIIATICAQFDLNGPLTPRDNAAPVFSGLISGDMKTLNIDRDFIPPVEKTLKKLPYPKNHKLLKTLPNDKYGSPAYAVYHTAFIKYGGKLKK